MKKIKEIPVVNLVKTGANIKMLRKKCGLSVAFIQEIFGFSTPQAVYKWERGTSLPTVDNALMLAGIFEVTINDIFIVDMIPVYGDVA